jgi:hypothetical protein
MFSFNLHKDKDYYKGYCISTTQGGNRIEYDDHAINFKVSEKPVVMTKFKIHETNKYGLIQLRLLGNNRMKLRVLKYPSGETTIPREAIMYRCGEPYLG